MFTHAVITIQLKLHLARFQLDFTQASYSPKSWLDYHSRYLNLLNVYNDFSECTFKYIWNCWINMTLWDGCFIKKYAYQISPTDWFSKYWYKRNISWGGCCIKKHAYSVSLTEWYTKYWYRKIPWIPKVLNLITLK